MFSSGNRARTITDRTGKATMAVVTSALIIHRLEVRLASNGCDRPGLALVTTSVMSDPF